MYRALIVEDDASQARHLKAHLERYAQQTSTAFSTTCYQSAVEFVETKQTFDVIFLDIGLPGIDGMEAAGILRTYDAETPLVFVTDLAQYAVQGYQVQAFGFLVKPVEYYDFKMLMDRVVRVIERSVDKNVYIPTRDGVRVVPMRDVVYIDVLNHSLSYHLEGGETVTVRGTLGATESSLTGLTFVRVSNSCLVNMRHIRSISGTDLTMSNGTICAVSRSKRKSALATIANYYGGNS